MTTQNKNVPALRFPEFNSIWEVKKLGDVFKFKQGVQCPVEKQFFERAEGFVRFIRIIDLTDSNEKPRFILSPGEEHQLTSDSLFMVRYGTPGLVGYGFDGVIANNLFQVIPQIPDLISNKFYYFVLTYKKEKLLKLSNSSTMPALNFGSLSLLTIPIPSKKEQQKIAAFLSVVDEKIQQLAKKKDLLEQYKKGVMQKIFNQEIRFKDDNGNDFTDWEEKKGNEVFDSISNKNHNSNLPILAITQDYGAIPRDLIDYQISVTDKSVESYKVVEVGDFIISLRSFQGGIEYSNYKGICSPAYIILRSKVSINNLFFKYYLKTDSYIQKMNAKLEGIRDGKMVSYKYFSEISLPFPSIEEQNKIASFFTAIDNKINPVNQQLEKTKEYKKGLLQQMFI